MSDDQHPSEHEKAPSDEQPRQVMEGDGSPKNPYSEIPTMAKPDDFEFTPIEDQT
jgi:hypothetical protein